MFGVGQHDDVEKMISVVFDECKYTIELRLCGEDAI
jgi:hypothetical protein